MRFSLLVLLVVLVVMMAVFLAKGRQTVAEAPARLDAAKAATLEPILQQVQDALGAYAEENGDPAADLEALLPRFLAYADLLVDPWGTRLRLEKDALGEYFLVCAGPDRIFATTDDTRRSL